MDEHISWRRMLAWFREQVHAAGGGNDQTLINQALRRFMEQGGEPLWRQGRRKRRGALHDTAITSTRAGDGRVKALGRENSVVTVPGRRTVEGR